MSQGSPLATPVPWNLVAPAYAAEVVPVFESFAREALRLSAPAAGSRVVDVACGPGTLSVLAAQGGFEVDAVDFSPAMIDELRRRIEAQKITTVRPQVADGQALPFGDGTFDAAFSMFGLMFFPDRARGFAELRRVLRAGARAVVSSWQPMDAVPVMGAMFASVREAMAQVIGGPVMGVPESPLTRAEDCRAEMSASFADVEVHERTCVMEAASADELWRGIARTMAPLVLMQKNLGERWSAVDQAASAAVRGAVGQGPARMTLTAHLTVGTAR